MYTEVSRTIACQLKRKGSKEQPPLAKAKNSNSELTTLNPSIAGLSSLHETSDAATQLVASGQHNWLQVDETISHHVGANQLLLKGKVNVIVMYQLA